MGITSKGFYDPPGSEIGYTANGIFTAAFQCPLWVVKMPNTAQPILPCLINDDTGYIITFDIRNLQVAMAVPNAYVFCHLGALRSVQSSIIGNQTDHLFSNKVNAIFQLFQKASLVSFRRVIEFTDGVPSNVQLESESPVIASEDPSDTIQCLRILN